MSEVTLKVNTDFGESQKGFEDFVSHTQRAASRLDKSIKSSANGINELYKAMSSSNARNATKKIDEQSKSMREYVKEAKQSGAISAKEAERYEKQLSALEKKEKALQDDVKSKKEIADKSLQEKEKAKQAYASQEGRDAVIGYTEDDVASLKSELSIRKKQRDAMLKLKDARAKGEEISEEDNDTIKGWAMSKLDKRVQAYNDEVKKAKGLASKIKSKQEELAQTEDKIAEVRNTRKSAQEEKKRLKGEQIALSDKAKIESANILKGIYSPLGEKNAREKIEQYSAQRKENEKRINELKKIIGKSGADESGLIEHASKISNEQMELEEEYKTQVSKVSSAKKGVEKFPTSLDYIKDSIVNDENIINDIEEEISKKEEAVGRMRSLIDETDEKLQNNDEFKKAKQQFDKNNESYEVAEMRLKDEQEKRKAIEDEIRKRIQLQEKYNSLGETDAKSKELKESVNGHSDKLKEMKESGIGAENSYFRSETAQYEKEKRDLDEVNKKLQEKANLEAVKPTGKIDNKYVEMKDQLDALIKRKKELESAGSAGKASDEYHQLTKEIERQNKALKMREHMKGYDNGTPFMNAVNSVGKMTGNISKAMKSAYSGGKKVFGVLGKITKPARTFMKTMGGDAIKSANKGFSKLIGHQKKTNSGFKNGALRMLKYALGIRSLYTLFTRLRSAWKEGLNNLVRFQGGMNSTNEAMSMLTSALKTLKNSVASMASPIVSLVAPALTSLINLLVRAANAAAAFFAALSGSKVFTKAIGLSEDYAKSLGGAGAAAKYLTGLDEIRIFDEGGGGGGGGQTAVDDMFSIEEIAYGISDFAEKVKKAWTDADFTEVGEIVGKKFTDIFNKIDEEAIESKLNRITSSIGTFINGFSNSGVIENFGENASEAINAVVGALNNFHDTVNWTNLGIRIANGLDNLVSGIDADALGERLTAKISAAFDTLYGFAITFKWDGLGDKIGTAIDSALNSINWEHVFTGGANIIGGIFTALTNAITTVDWGAVATKIINAIAKVDWESLIENVGGFFDAVSKMIEEIKKAFDDSKNKDKIIECATKLLVTLSTGILDNLSTLTGIGLDIIGQVVDELLKEENKTKLVDAGKELLGAIWEGLSGSETGTTVRNAAIGIGAGEVALGGLKLGLDVAEWVKIANLTNALKGMATGAAEAGATTTALAGTTATFAETAAGAAAVTGESLAAVGETAATVEGTTAALTETTAAGSSVLAGAGGVILSTVAFYGSLLAMLGLVDKAVMDDIKAEGELAEAQEYAAFHTQAYADAISEAKEAGDELREVELSMNAAHTDMISAQIALSDAQKGYNEEILESARCLVDLDENCTDAAYAYQLLLEAGYGNIVELEDWREEITRLAGIYNDSKDTFNYWSDAYSSLTGELSASNKTAYLEATEIARNFIASQRQVMTDDENDKRAMVKNAKKYAAEYKEKWEKNIDGYTVEGYLELLDFISEIDEGSAYMVEGAGEVADKVIYYSKQALESNKVDLETAAKDARTKAEEYKNNFSKGIAGFTAEGALELEQWAAFLEEQLSYGAEVGKTETQALADNISSTIEGNKKSLQDKAKKFANLLPEAVEEAKATTTTKAGETVDSYCNTFSNGTTIVKARAAGKSLPTHAIEGIDGETNTVKTHAGSIIKSAWGEMNAQAEDPTSISTLKSKLQTSISGAAETVSGAIKSLLGTDNNKTIEEGAQSLFEAIKGQVNNTESRQEVYNSGYSVGMDFASGMHDGMDDYNYLVSLAAERLADAVKDSVNLHLDIGSPSTVAYEQGMWYDKGLANGLSQTSQICQDAAAGVAYKVNKTVTLTWRIGSPSKVAAGLGEYYGEGLAIGIEDSEGNVTSAAENLAMAANDTLNGTGEYNIIGNAQSVLENISSFGDRIATGFSNLCDTLNSIFAAMENRFATVNMALANFASLGSVTMRTPIMSTGTVIPPRIEEMAESLNNIDRRLEELYSFLRNNAVNEDRTRQNSQYEFTAQINRRTLFSEIINEAQLQRVATGQNPFLLGR